MSTQYPRIVDVDEAPENRRHGAELRTMLTPTSCGATSGFMGLAIVRPGERITEHYHPYSEEFVFVVSGDLEVDLDGETRALKPDQGLMIPINMRHRFRNVGTTEARMVFHLGPLAPRPDLGHVSTEDHADGGGHADGEGHAGTGESAASGPPEHAKVAS